MITLEPGEHVVLDVRHHWYVFFVQILPIIFLALVLLAVVTLPGIFAVFNLNIVLGPEVLVFVIAGWLMLWIIFAIVWTGYYLDTWVITNHRVVSIEQYTLFSRKVSECRLDRVQDVTVEVNGFLPTLLRFGTVAIQTAGESSQFVMKDIPDPDRVKDVIFQGIGGEKH